MPNWVKNVVKIKNVKNAEEIIDMFTTVYENGKKGFDFNKIIPKAKELDITEGSYKSSAIKLALYYKEEKEREEIVKKLNQCSDFEIYSSSIDLNKIHDIEHTDAQNFKPSEIEKELGIKSLRDLGFQYINNVLNYGHTTWYNWSISNWGTKWNACEPEIIIGKNYVKFIFDTAWSTPEPIFQKMTEMINNDIEIWFADEDIGNNCGKFYFFDEGSQEFEDKNNDREFARRVWRM